MNKEYMTIIVPIYNTPSNYLKICIDSIINQTFKNIEIILINDGSSKDIRGICENYASYDERIRLINQENQGESVSRNLGISLAETDNIIFVDSDDYVELNMCEELYKFIESINDKFDIIIYDCQVVSNKKITKNSFYHKNGKLTKKDIEQIELQNIEKGISQYYPPACNISVPWCKVYKKDFLIKNHLKFIPNMTLMPDAIFNMNCFENAQNIYCFNKFLCYYRKYNGSISQKYNENIIKEYENYFSLVSLYIEKCHKNEKFKDILNVKIITSFDKYMQRYFFNYQNKENKETKELKFQQLINKDLYQKALKNVKIKYLGLYQKLIYNNIKKKNIKVLKKLQWLKYILKK